MISGSDGQERLILASSSATSFRGRVTKLPVRDYSSVSWFTLLYLFSRLVPGKMLEKKNERIFLKRFTAANEPQQACDLEFYFYLIFAGIRQTDGDFKELKEEEYRLTEIAFCLNLIKEFVSCNNYFLSQLTNHLC